MSLDGFKELVFPIRGKRVNTMLIHIMILLNQYLWSLVMYFFKYRRWWEHNAKNIARVFRFIPRLFWFVYSSYVHCSNMKKTV